MEFFIQNFENIFKILILTFGAVGFYFAIKNDISSLKRELCHVKDNQRSIVESISKLSQLLIQVAIQDTRLNMLEKKLDDLSHGHGFVTTKVN